MFASFTAILTENSLTDKHQDNVVTKGTKGSSHIASHVIILPIPLKAKQILLLKKRR